MIHGRRNTDISDEPLDKLIFESSSNEIKTMCIYLKKITNTVFNMDDNIHCLKDSVDSIKEEIKNLAANKIESENKFKDLKKDKNIWLKSMSLVLTLTVSLLGYTFTEFKKTYTSVILLEEKVALLENNHFKTHKK